MHDAARADIGALGELNVLGNIDDDRTGPAAARDVKRLVQDPGEIVHVADEIVMLGAGARDADRVAFLERVAADHMRGNLAGEADERDGIHQRVGQPGHGIGRAGARRNQQHADLARRARIAFGRVRGALLMAYEHVTDAVLLEQFVIDRQHRAAGIAEDIFDTLIGKGLQDDFRTSHHASHRSTPNFASSARSASAFAQEKALPS